MSGRKPEGNFTQSKPLSGAQQIHLNLPTDIHPALREGYVNLLRKGIKKKKRPEIQGHFIPKSWMVSETQLDT